MLGDDKLLELDRSMRDATALQHQEVGDVLEDYDPADFADIGRRKETPTGRDILIIDCVEISFGALEPRDTDPSYFGSMYPAKLSNRMVMFVDSTLDQLASVQPVGSFSNAAGEPSMHFDIGAPTAVAAGGRASIVINLDDNWHPFMGLVITPATAPSEGRISARLFSQEWFPPRKP